MKGVLSLRTKISMSLDRLFQGLVRSAQTKSYFVLVIAGLLFIGAIFLMGSLKMELDLYDILDPSLKSSQNQWTMREQFVDVNSIFVTVYSDQDISSVQACQLKKYLISYSNSSPDIERITAPWSIRMPSREGDKLWYRHFVEDPCSANSQALVRDQWSVFRNTPWQFFFLGKNPNQIPLEVAFKDVEGANGVKKFDVVAIDRFVKGFDQFVHKDLPGFQYHVFGHVSFRWHILQTLKKDFIWNIAIMIFFSLFFYFFLGTWRAGIYYGISLIFTEVLLFGIMSLIGFPIDLMSNCLILMTAIAGVSDFLFVSSAQKENQLWHESFIAVATPSFFTSLTTVCGFMSLGLSEIPAISRFGFAAAIGATCQWFATFIILPAIMRVLKVKKNWVQATPYSQIKSKWFLKLNRIFPNRIFTSALILVSFISLMGISHLNIGDNILQNFAKEHPLTKAYNWLRSDKDWQGQIFLLFEPQVSKTDAQKILTKINQVQNVRHVENPMEIESFITKGLTPGDQSLVLREMSLGFLKKYRSSDNYLRVPIYTNSMDLKILKNVVHDIESLCGDQCFLAGQTLVYLEYSDRISRTLIDSLLTSIFTVALLILLLAWIRGHNNYLSLILSSVWGPMMMMGFLWWTQLPVTSVTSIFFALIVGWTGDNAIQYLFASDDIVEGAEARASATLMQTLLFCGSSMFFVFHTFVPMKILGMLFVVGFFMTYVGDLWVLKGLLNFKRSNRPKS